MDLLIKIPGVGFFTRLYRRCLYKEWNNTWNRKRFRKKDCKIIDGIGKVLMPSFIDFTCNTFRRTRLHLYKEDIESGCKAAAKGGYTYVNLMANTNPVCSNMNTVNYVIDKADKIGLIGCTSSSIYN